MNLDLGSIASVVLPGVAIPSLTLSSLAGQSNSVGDNVTDAIGLTNHAGDRALAAQKKAAEDANATQLYMYNQTRADNEPWRQAGTGALSGLVANDFMKDWQQDPGYQFRMSEGQKSINNAAAARGMGRSGATMKALTEYGQNLASAEYNNVYNRQYNRLSALAGFGQGANNQNGSASTNYANQVSNNQIALGNAYAANQVAQSNRANQMIGTGVGLGIAAFSDARLKTNVTEVSSDDLAEMKKHLKAYAFNYVSDDYGRGDWIGVMAQDLEKSKLGKTLVFEDEYGNKKIDLKKVLSMFLATMAGA